MFFLPRFFRGTRLSVTALLLVLSFWTGGAPAAPVISEFLAINSGDGLVDEDGDSSDWVEIHNLDGEAIDLAGYGLSDDEDQALRWQFPAVTIEPGGYLVVFASGKDRAVPGMELHTNFSLDGDGEYLALSDPAGIPISSFVPEYPKQQRDTSFGLSSVGGIGYLLVPTPGTANGAALASLTEAPSFSVEHGYYSRPVLLEISAAPGSKILYTTDGSVPTRLNGQVYREPIIVGATTIFRAVAMLPDAVPSTVVTSSYLFPADIKNQARMSQAVVASPDYEAEIEAAIAALPAISLAMSEERFLGPDGIYTNFQDRGREAEVPVSVEYFDPEGEGNGDGGFQIDAGIRIHGGQARFHEKKPLRLYFRSDYGAGRLDYPLFDGSPVKDFDRLVMRSCGHDGWAIDWGGGRNDLTESATYMRDEFMRRSEQEMGLLSPFGKFVHVFVNGEYWGMYDLHERADAAYFASHEGGDESDWDVIEGGGFLTEGESGAWDQLLSLGTARVTSAGQYAEIEKLLDIDQFIDSMISRIWSGDNDWLGPVYFGNFSTGVNNRNWIAGRRSRGADDQPFHFFAWDAEISLGNDRFTNSGNRMLETDLTRVNTPNSPSVPYDGLRNYEEFQVKFADRIYRSFFNGGALTPERAKARWDSLSERVREPVVAESARWGNIHGGVPLRRNVEWEDERIWVRDTFLDRRTGIVLAQFRARGLYPNVDPPEFPSVVGGVYPAAVDVVLAIPSGQAGEIFYTIDGSDPRRSASAEVGVLLQEFAPAKVLVPSVANGGAALGAGWKEFDAPSGIDGWIDGAAAVGYEVQGTDYRSLLRVDVENEMFGINGSVYLRTEFDVRDQAAIDAIERLVLKMKYDDGFIAYLNGVKVAEINAPTAPVWNSLATGGQPDATAVLFQDFDISADKGLLRPGRNVLALQGLNGSVDSSDLLLVPSIIASGAEATAGLGDSALAYAGAIPVAGSTVINTRFRSSAGEWSALREETFVIGQRAARAGDLVISEFNYHPRDPEGAAEQAVAGNDSDFEFIEVLNIAAEAVEMGEVQFSDGIDFVFPAGALAAGDRLLVVRRRAAFEVRYPAVPGALIAGEFAGGTGLSNGGERIVLADASGEPIVDFEYDDRSPWPEAADGGGVALVLIDPQSAPEHGLAENWRPSRLNDGSPGGDEDAFDVDADGLPDDWELRWFGDLAQPADGDGDGDGLDHAMEFEARTDPTSSDTDFDGVADGAEIAAGTDPLVRDSDGDGLSDGIEILVHRSDPLRRDSDGDGLDDGREVFDSGTDPLSRDSDGDGSGDFTEVQRGSDPLSADEVALARAGDFLIYASMDSPDFLGGGDLAMDWAPVEGAVAGGLCFAGADSITYGEIGDPGAGALSAMLWFKLDSLAGQRTLVSKGDGWALEADGGSVSWRVDGVGEISLESSVTVGVWHHAALVIDQEVGMVIGFFDGQEIASLAIPDGLLIDAPEGLNLAGGGNAGVCLDEFALLKFGMNAAEIRAIYNGGGLGMRVVDVVGSADMDLDGLIDEWELVNFGDLTQIGSSDADGDGLTNREEQQLGTDPLLADSDGDGIDDRLEILSGSDPLDPKGGSSLLEGLLLYSSFDSTTVTGSGSGARVFDLSVPAENGVVSGPIGIVPGRIGGGAKQTAGLVSYGDVHNPGTGSYSVSVWFQADRLEPGMIQRVVGKGRIDGEGGSTGWQIAVFGEEVAVIGGVEGGAEWFLRGMPAGQASLRVGEWNHAVLVIDRSPGSGPVRLFVNGAEIAAERPTDTALADGLPITDSSALITHGKSGDGTGFSGAIDELAVWGRAISPIEVGALYRGALLTASVDDLTGAAGLDPEFYSFPEQISFVLNPGQQGNFDGVLRNVGDGRAQWFANLSFAEELSLETALEQIDSNAATLLDSIPFRFGFTEGVVGNSIGDGGLDMFDGGNILGTDKASGIPYSDGRVISSPAFGSAGSYFTRKLAGGLFVLGADLDGVEFFQVTGDLGADGIGIADGLVLTTERGGRQFQAFVKRVYDGLDLNSGIFDPTVNHMIIIESAAMANHTFSTNTNLDEHRVSGLSGTDRLYHLLYSSSEGLMISDEDTQAIFETFLDTVGVAPGWLQFEQDAGQIEAGSAFRFGMNFDAGAMAPGVEEAVIHMFSNDPERAEIDIPVRLRINSAPLGGEPLQLDIDEDSEPLQIDLTSLFEDDGAADGESLSFELLSVSDTSILRPAGTIIPGGQLSIVLVPDAFGVASVQVRATDPQGLFADSSVTIRVAAVNDPPEIRRALFVQVDEDSGPVRVPLREYFTDIEDGPDGLSFANSPPSSGDLIGPPFLNRATGELRFGLVPNANGSLLLPLTVTDSEGGVLEADLQVIVRSVPDPPMAVGVIPDVIADAAANDSVVLAGNYFRDPDLDDMLRYAVADNTNPELFSSLTIDRVTGELDIIYAPFVSGVATITVRAVDARGGSADQVFRVVLPEIDLPRVVAESDLKLNRQTGLWEQTVTVTNVAQRAIGAVRLLIGGLEQGISVHNASEQLIDGRFELLYNRTLPAGESVSIVVEYYSPDRRRTVTPEIEVEVSLRKESISTSSGFGIDRVLRLDGGALLVEFPSEPGALYQIQYSSDMRSWRDALVRLRAGGTRVQWIDRGGPSTDSIPLGAGLGRFYRVLKLAE